MTNIVMISVDDMNAYASVLGAYPGTVHMPNLERLAAQGTTFTSAYATTPLCGPARASVMTGMSPLSTGVFTNTQFLLDSVAPEQTLPSQLQSAGYTTVNAGKVFHAVPPASAAQFYDTVLSTGSTNGAEHGDENLIPTMTTFAGGIYTGDPDKLGDSMTVEKVEDFLAGYTPDPGSAGLFLSVGLTSTHGPRYLPQEYFDLYPLEDIILPDTPPGDLDDIPDFARQFVGDEQFEAMIAAGDWPRFVQAYLASLTYMDAMLGRLLDAIEASAIGGDTMIALWSDHGFHLGDKETTGKVTLWENAARAPLIIVDPSADPSRVGVEEDQVVSMIDLYSTVLDYAGAAPPAWAEGQSLLNLVRTGDATGLDGTAVTLIDGNFSLRTEQYRYTRYEDGSEELYDIQADPEQYVNLAALPEHAATKAALSAELDAWTAEYGYEANTTATPTLLVGGDGRDVMVAGFGADTLEGGLGDDVYLLRQSDQLVVEAPGAGRDQVIIGGDWTNYTLPNGVEDLFFERNGGNVAAAIAWTVVANGLDNIIEVGGPEDGGGKTPLWLDAGGGNDVVVGSDGPGTLFGGAGNDSVSGGGVSDTLDGGDGADTLFGSGSGDSLQGQAGNDSLVGDAGFDTLQGGAGADRMAGGEEGDVYIASAGADRITETGRTGMDMIDVTPWGGRAAMTVTENRDGTGKLLTVSFARTGSADSILVQAQGGANPIEALLDNGLTILLSPQSVIGGAGPDRFEGSPGADTIFGSQGADAIDGADGPDSLGGGPGADTLRGGAGNDLFVFGLMEGDVGFGGDGDDIFLVTGGSGSLDGGPGRDGMQVGVNVAGIIIVNVERIELLERATARADRLGDPALQEVVGVEPGASIAVFDTGIVDLSRLALEGLVVRGDGLANRILLGNGAIRAEGGDGADDIQAGADAQTVDGGAGNDTLRGGAGDNTMLGGLGLDSLTGEAGADSLSGAEEDDALSGGDGLDTLAGGAANDRLDGGRDADVLGGEAGNDQILGGEGADSLAGDAGLDTLSGGSGADSLAGGDGDDRLDGGAGADSMAGGTGNDRYTVAESQDRVVELAGEGRDTVVASVDYALEAGQEIESLTLTGAALAAAGNELANALIGNAGANTLIGGGGTDSLSGADGNDSLDGGTGADTMAGGAGNDVFVVDDALDVVGEAAGAGTDTVRSAITWTLGANLETLILTGAAAIGGAGNTLANSLLGNGAANGLDGAAGNDTLRGEDGADTLLGGTGADSLDGGAGADSMIGAAGNDVFVVDTALDAVSEAGNGGLDTVRASVTWTLGAHVEALVLTGTATIDGAGNDLDNSLTGNNGANLLSGAAGADTVDGGGGRDSLAGGDGDDVLDGGSGPDTLAGGAGLDRFRFASSSHGSDQITDFAAGEDLIWISAAGFGGVLAIGPLAASSITFGAAAVGPGPQLVYSAATGELGWDADGAGGAAAVRLATLVNRPVLDLDDFAVVA